MPRTLQFKLLVKRSLTQFSRNPVAIFAIFIMAVFQGLLMGVLFWKVGRENFSSSESAPQIAGNFMGMAFLVSCDQFITMSFG